MIAIGAFYDDLGADHFNRSGKPNRIERLAAKVQSLGYAVSIWPRSTRGQCGGCCSRAARNGAAACRAQLEPEPNAIDLSRDFRPFRVRRGRRHLADFFRQRLGRVETGVMSICSRFVELGGEASGASRSYGVAAERSSIPHEDGASPRGSFLGCVPFSTRSPLMGSTSAAAC